MISQRHDWWLLLLQLLECSYQFIVLHVLYNGDDITRSSNGRFSKHTLVGGTAEEPLSKAASL